MEHTVFCVKFKRQMPGLDEPPFDNELGKKVYDNVSQEAWKMWVEHCKMLLNEYRLNPCAARRSGSYCEADGYVFLRRGIGEAEGVCAAEGVSTGA